MHFFSYDYLIESLTDSNIILHPTCNHIIFPKTKHWNLNTCEFMFASENFAEIYWRTNISLNVCIIYYLRLSTENKCARSLTGCNVDFRLKHSSSTNHRQELQNYFAPFDVNGELSLPQLMRETSEQSMKTTKSDSRSTVEVENVEMDMDVHTTKITTRRLSISRQFWKSYEFQWKNLPKQQQCRTKKKEENKNPKTKFPSLRLFFVVVVVRFR